MKKGINKEELDYVLESLHAKKEKTLKFAYADGVNIYQVWFEKLDGKWPYGDEDEKTIEYNFNFNKEQKK